VLTYQTRPRVLYFDDTRRPSYPAEVHIEFVFEPIPPFGGAIGETMTLKVGSTPTGHWDSNTGKSWMEATEPLDPVDVVAQAPKATYTFVGNVLTVVGIVPDRRSLGDLIASIHYGAPLLLNLDFLDAPYVTKVTGRIGDLPFVWGLARSKGHWMGTTTETQEEYIGAIWERFTLIGPTGSTRLLAALGSFYMACRLARAGIASHEFSGETILNFAKTLEALFPPVGDSSSMDQARLGLPSLGYSKDEIEAWFVPAIALRNQIDIGHSFLSMLTSEQLAVVHDYVDDAESRFRELLGRVVAGLEGGSFELAPYVDAPSSKAATVVRRMSEAAEAVGRFLH
jgi:hypothetical protein